MTQKQIRFIQEYLIDLNATQAAIRAGYVTNLPNQVGYENLKKPKIAEAIRQAMESHKQTLIIMEAETVLVRLSQLAMGAKREADQLKALELLGKRYGLFTEKHELEHKGIPEQGPSAHELFMMLKDPEAAHALKVIVEKRIELRQINFN